jgi:DNA gyrase subunit A
VLLTTGNEELLIGTHNGYCVRFKENILRDTGRVASGVKGINLREGDFVVGSSTIDNTQEVLVISENGLGKRTAAEQYSTKHRGGKGIKVMKITERTGKLAGLVTVKGHEDLMMITDTGVMIRINVDNLSQTARDTQGVKVMRLDKEAHIMTFALVEPEPDEFNAAEEIVSEESK